MRRRSRDTDSPGDSPGHPANADNGSRYTAVDSAATLDEALRSLARLLARQAAREIVNRESRLATDDEPSSEDLQ